MQSPGHLSGRRLFFEMFLARAFKHVRKWRRAKKQVGINQEKQNILADSLDAPSEFVSRSSPSKFSRLVKCDQIKMFITINTSRTFLDLQSDFICRGSMAQLDRRALRPVARSTQLGSCCKRLWNESDILRDFARLDRKCSSCFLSIVYRCIYSIHNVHLVLARASTCLWWNMFTSWCRTLMSYCYAKYLSNSKDVKGIENSKMRLVCSRC